jgi:alanyl-tRNA synthetase
LREFDAMVTGVDGNSVVLDRTCFFPQGGGQACDTGYLSGCKVMNTVWAGDEVRHVLIDPLFVIGQAVQGVIDWERRYRVMRLHSASHLVYYMMQDVFGDRCRPASSGQLDDNKDRTDYLFNEPLERERLALVEKKVNSLIEDKLPISHSLEQGSGERLLWRISTFPAIECGGTHVRNTIEIGQISVKRGSKPGRGRERIELTLT